MNKSSNWNTWDVRCLNAVMHIPDLAEIRIGIYDDNMKFFQDEMLWKNVSRFGYHDLDEKYFDLDLKYKNFIFKVEFTGSQDQFAFRITPLNSFKYLKFFISGLFRWNMDGTVRKSRNNLFLKSDINEYKIDVIGGTDEATSINVSHSGILVQSDNVIYIRCNNEMAPYEIDKLIDNSRKEYEKKMVSGKGMIREVPEAISKGIAWNTIYEPIKKRYCTPVSREWCAGNGTGFGSYVLFEWDTFLAGILSSSYSKELAYTHIDSILSEATQAGFIPNFASQFSSSEDRSQPPVGSYCVLKIYRQFREKEFLEKHFEKLLKWNKWWIPNRDGNRDGLLEWGSNRFSFGEGQWQLAHDLKSAMYESGLDNSPMYDDVVFNKDTNTMELADVGLNSLYAMDCWALAEIADITGKVEIAEELRNEYGRIKDMINSQLWDEEKGIYLNRHWNGEFSGRLSPTAFYPLIAGVASEHQAKRMIEEHLLNEKEFWGQYVIPSIAKDDPAYPDNDYWRGRIWGPMNFLVSEGIKRYGYYNVSFEFSKKSVELFLKEWTEKNHIHENYNSITGEGDDVGNADPVYTWGGLLGYAGIGELIEFQPWSGIRIGNLGDVEMSVYNYVVCDERYDVIMDKGLTVNINGIPFIRSDVPVIVTNIIKDTAKVAMDIKSNKSGTVSIYNDTVINLAVIKINGRCYELKPEKQEITIGF